MPAELSAPPNDVHTESIYSNQLVFSWSPVTAQCPHIQYVITSVNCGICSSITNHTFVTCSDFSVSVHGTLRCMFAIQTDVCGSILGEMSDLIVLNLTCECNNCYKINVFTY